MRLDDHACGARREGVAAAREIGAGDRLGDRAGLGGDGEVLRVDIGAVGRGAGDGGRGRAGHVEHREHVADAIGNRDHGGQAALARLGGGVRDDRLDIGDAQRFGRGHGIEIGRAGRGRGSRAGRGAWRAAASPAAARLEEEARSPREGPRRASSERPDAAHRAAQCRAEFGGRDSRWAPSPRHRRG